MLINVFSRPQSSTGRQCCVVCVETKLQASTMASTLARAARYCPKFTFNSVKRDVLLHELNKLSGLCIV